MGSGLSDCFVGDEAGRRRNLGLQTKKRSSWRRGGSARAGRARGHGDEPVFIGFVGAGNGEGDRRGDSIGVNRVVGDYRTQIGGGCLCPTGAIPNQIPYLYCLFADCFFAAELMAEFELFISLVVGKFLQ
ncbi:MULTISPECIES: hypothetical protein [unclassified Pseudomonas]|uniref:hypothetical protein n=1 Tax=unclassified Pseudomonas TaxID=196821 RepID=UPI00111C435C|nr:MULTISPECIES: hypothetical protein [unclassified Pseudomonas]